jgi:hypothetical protein
MDVPLHARSGTWVDEPFEKVHPVYAPGVKKALTELA